MITINDGLFVLETKDTSYCMGVHEGLVENLHYGGKIHADIDVLKEKTATGYGGDVLYNKETSLMSLFHLCLELSPTNKGDYRHCALEIELSNSVRVCNFTFKNARMLSGDIPLKDMPSAYGADDTLVLEFTSPEGVDVDIYYGCYNSCNVITRRTAIKNNTGKEITLFKCLSYQLDLRGTDYNLHTFTGAWARERFETVTKLQNGSCTFGSTTGVSSNHCNPFFMVSKETATEHSGDVFAFNLIYSGSHYGEVEVGPYSKTRISAGIQPSGFKHILQNGDVFDTPEAVMTYSSCGKNGISENMHKFVNNHIVRGTWKNKERPILLNNWEATYFDFNAAKLLSLAKDAKKLGIELFVLDDGWFGKRDSDKRGLGDYNVNTKKLPGGLGALSQKIKKMGMMFGVWVEPEMVNPDSELFKEHPDWAVFVPGGVPSESRNQLVLDLCREDVQNYIIENVNNTIKLADADYIKWDMNRPLSDLYSSVIPCQGEFMHTWVKGLYKIMQAIVNANPNVLFEGCASGGNRFDLGILCYMPQIWTSDDTDAYERTKIQTGTSYGYPQSTMGCHVSASPNHQTARSSPIESRFDVAAFGVLGYELDVTQIKSAEKKVVISQIEFYKKHRKLLQFGNFYRLISPFNDSEKCAWLIVSDDKKQALVLDFIGRMNPNFETTPIVLKHLCKDTKYNISVRKQYINIGTFGSLINHVMPVKLNSDGLIMRTAADYYMLPCEDDNFTAYGDLLMCAGLRTKQNFAGTGYNENVRLMPDYSARIYYLCAQNTESENNI